MAELSSYQKAAKKMADFWAGLLQTGAADALAKRWAEGKTSPDQFDLEFTQASSALSGKQEYSPEQVKAFRDALEAGILDNRVGEIRMKYHPDPVLEAAGEKAGIDVNMLTFPIGTETSYNGYRECLRIYQGENEEKIYLNPDLPRTYAYFVYQTSPDEPVKTLKLEEDDPNINQREAIDKIIAERENRPTYTINFTDLCYTTSEEEAIKSAITPRTEYGAGYKYKTPNQVANQWLMNTASRINKDAPEVIRFLVEERGAEVETVNEYGRTPLYIALENHRLPNAKMLLELGAQYTPDVIELLGSKRGGRLPYDPETEHFPVSKRSKPFDPPEPSGF
jgi:hypothetical protein